MNKNTILKKLINESVNSILSELDLRTVDDAYNKAYNNWSDYDTLENFPNDCNEIIDIFDRLYGNEPSSEGYKLGQELEDLALRISNFGKRKSVQSDNIDRKRDARYVKEFGKDFNGMRDEIDDIYAQHSDDEDVMADTPEWKDKYMTPRQRRFNDEHYDV
jgi:hypothetical protein